MNENAEKVQTQQVVPAPVTPATDIVAKANAPAEVTPSTSTEAIAEKKRNAAYAAMRKELREAKNKLAEATAISSPAPVQAETPAPAQVDTLKAQVPATPKAEVDIEAESVKAIEELSNDATVAKVPGMVLDIVDLVDTDPRLKRLHSIDPVLAFREAKGIILAKAGITAAPPIPTSAPVSGGIAGAGKDLAALIAAAEKERPGSKEHNHLVKQINAELAKNKDLDSW